MTAFTLCGAPTIEERRVDLKSGYPYWAVKNGLMHAFPPLQADASCEVAVIGGGISGALIADELSRHGHEVLVIEQRDVAWGSTSASTALLQYEIDTHLVDSVGARERGIFRPAFARGVSVARQRSPAARAAIMTAMNTIATASFTTFVQLHLGHSSQARGVPLRARIPGRVLQCVTCCV